MRKIVLFLLGTALLAGCSGDKKSGEINHQIVEGKIVIPAEAVTTSSGLKYLDVVVGDGESPKAGQMVMVHYNGLLMNGKKFDSSYDRGATLDFPVGIGKVIPGFDEGLMSMNVGGKRVLYIPSELGYGSNEIPGVIPANSDLVFEIELVGIK